MNAVLAFHVIALFYTTMRIASLNRYRMRYRPFYSLVAYVWAGGCGSLAILMITHWPDAVGHVNAITAAIVGASAGLAWWCRGNVAELFRKLHLDPSWY